MREEERMSNGNNQANKERETADERRGDCRTNGTTQQADTGASPYRIHGICSIASNCSTSHEIADLFNISHTLISHSI